METNAFDISESFGQLAGTIFQSAADGLSGAHEELTNGGVAGELLSALVAVLAALLVIWGSWFVVKMVLRAVRTTK